MSLPNPLNEYFSKHPTERGLLAFLYAIAWDPKINPYFKNNADEVMDRFQIPDAAKPLINQLHTDPESGAEPKWKELLAMLLPEFYEWTYKQPKPNEPPYWW